jgi:hypothetical protein
MSDIWLRSFWVLECWVPHRQAEEACRTFGCVVSGSLSVRRLTDKLIKHVGHSVEQFRGD